MKKTIFTILIYFFAVTLWSVMVSAGVPSNALDNMQAGAEMYAQSINLVGKSYEKIDPIYDTSEEFWNRIFAYAVNDYKKVQDEGFSGGESLYSEREIIDIAYALFSNFDGKVPAYNYDSNGFISYENGYYRFMLFTQEQHEFYLSDFKENSDGSLNATYILSYLDYDESNPSESDWMEPYSNCSIHYELNPHVNIDSARPLYYRFSEIECSRIENEVPTTSVINNEYILPDSNIRYYSEQELADLTLQQLSYARNEIYARHGRKFKDQGLQSYFDSKSWYHGTIEPNDFDASVFNDYEDANVKLIVRVEKER